MSNTRGGVWEFEIEGPLVAAVRTTSRQKWVCPRWKKYVAFKERVRLLASSKGIPEVLEHNDEVRVEIDVRWRLRARADGDNIIKGIIDAIFFQDRRVLGIIYSSQEHEGCEGASVKITLMREDRK